MLALKKRQFQAEHGSSFPERFRGGPADVALPGLTRTAKRVALGSSSCMSREPLGVTSLTKIIDTGCVAARMREARDEPQRHRVLLTPNTIGIVAVAALAASVDGLRRVWRSQPPDAR